jgi:hypothetical protein
MSRSIKSTDAQHIEPMKEIELEVLKIEQQGRSQRTRAICATVVICVTSICGLLAYMHTPGIVHFIEAITGAFVAASASIVGVIKAADVYRRDQVKRAKRRDPSVQADAPQSIEGPGSFLYSLGSKPPPAGTGPESTHAERDNSEEENK